ncbi:hypothetical protein MMC08_007332, partial [Hypocenomyce scalaris]|nr:hypothetical protein [Hypocenomyce scalaris]
MDHNSDAHIHTDIFGMAPAKKPRLETVDPAALTGPATPIDDMDDIYDTRQASGSPQREEIAAHTSEAQPLFTIQPTFNLPGLGVPDVIPTIGEHEEEVRVFSEPVQMEERETTEPRDGAPAGETATPYAPPSGPKLNENLVGPGNDRFVENRTAGPTNIPEELKSMPSHDVVEHDGSRVGSGGANDDGEAKISPGQTGGEELGNEENLGFKVALQASHPQTATMPEFLAVDGEMTERLPEVENIAETALIPNISTVAQALISRSDELNHAPLPASADEDAAAKVGAHTSFERAEADQATGDAEVELDSSPIDSSSSDISSDSSSSDSDDYEMLDPEEQARRLMQEDGGSDDEAGKKGGNAAGGGPLRTLNEKPDEVVQKPDLIVTPEMKIEELGNVENLVENIVLIKAKMSGEYQVLETGSVLCLEDRNVIGLVAETLGRVQQPLYSVRFTDATAISDAGIAK